MKYAVIVLANLKNPLSSVDFQGVTDAFLSGGVFLDEVLVLPYDAPGTISKHIMRLSEECDGVFLICDNVLLNFAKQTVDSATGESVKFEGVLKETRDRLYGVIPANEE